MIRNRSQFLVNSEIHHINTRQHANFHQPSVNVAKYQKGVYYLGVKVFNVLPSDIKIEFSNPKKFKVVLFLGRIFRPSETLNLHLDTHLPICAIIYLYTT